ncbi:MAG: 50S ribosomal protein L1 [bacterium]
MTTRSKRYQDAVETIDPEKDYTLSEAINLVLDAANTNFEESIECHVRLGIDPEDADQQVRGSIVLPAGTGRDVTVIVFAQGEKKQEAEDAGADEVGGEDLIEKIDDGWLEFDQAIATPDMMSDVSRLGPVLGPRGLMPNNKAGTVTFDIADAVDKVKKGQIELRNDSYGIIHTVAGTDSMSTDQLEENLTAIFEFIEDERPPGIEGRGQYFKSISLSSSMSPSVSVDPGDVLSRVTSE